MGAENDYKNTIICGDALNVLKTLPDQSVNCCVTSPPYWGLRNYNVDGQIGLEKTPEEYVEGLVEIFGEVKRVLRNDGTVWVVLGDSYATNPGNGRGGESVDGGVPHRGGIDKSGCGLKPKDLVGIPWRVAFALQADGWWLRSDIIWHKPAPMPESVTDRPTKSHEHIFLLAKSKHYYYDQDATKEPSSNGGKSVSLGEKSFSKGQANGAGVAPSGNALADRYIVPALRNKRDVGTVTTKPFKGAHFAAFPPDLIRPCILAGCPKDGIVLDPFFGAGTTGVVTKQEGRNYVGIELNPEYVEMAQERIDNEPPRLI